MYYRKSFEHSPIKVFMNSNSADTIINRGNITFNLRHNIDLPNNVIGYVSLSAKSAIDTTFTITPGNYTVTSLMNALNTLFNTCTTVSFQSRGVTYCDITNIYTFSQRQSNL